MFSFVREQWQSSRAASLRYAPFRRYTCLQFPVSQYKRSHNLFSLDHSVKLKHGKNILRAMTNAKVFLIFLLLTAAGCASLDDRQRPQHLAAEPTAVACRQHFTDLDTTIDAAGIRDGGEAGMDSFPYLRVSRFLASFAVDFQTEDARASVDFAAWVTELRALDHAAREAEISNLPAAALTTLRLSKSDIRARTADCAALMMTADMSNAARRAAMVTAARVPDDYSSFKRLLGAYPLTKIPFFRGVEGWQRGAALKIQRAESTPLSAQFITRYSSANAFQSGSQSENIFSKFRNAPRSSLGIPSLSANEWMQLFDAHAPVFEVETTSEDDHIGTLQWRDDAAFNETPLVDIARPAIYRRISHTRIGGKTFAQLVYSVWFPSRPREHAFDLLSGALDSVIWRVTLDDDGAPLIHDSIHGCGCYHLFFPTSRVKLKPPPEANIEWAFVPKNVPSIAPPQRIVLQIAATSHYIVGVNVGTAGNTQSKTYQWRDEEELRALPVADGSTRSIFQPNGLIAGTERGERFLFWPMGIASPGAMRQWGRHATAFVGIRHFDDADLLDKRFTVVNKY